MNIYGGIAPAFMTSTIDGGEWSASRSCRFTPGEWTAGTHCLEDRATLYVVEKRKTLPLSGMQPRPYNP
jgi:hypothetical protein